MASNKIDAKTDTRISIPENLKCDEDFKKGFALGEKEVMTRRLKVDFDRGFALGATDAELRRLKAEQDEIGREIGDLEKRKAELEKAK